MPVEYEHFEQVALFQWAAAEVSRWPELDEMYANGNGGKRPRATAAKMKAEGVKAGVPDITLPVARGIYHGFYIELKAIYPDGSRGSPSKDQRKRIKALRERGYKAEVYWGWEQARDAIIDYLKGEPYECQ